MAALPVSHLPAVLQGWHVGTDHCQLHAFWALQTLQTAVVQAETAVSRSMLGVQLVTRYAGEAVGAGVSEDETTAAYSCVAMSAEVACLVISQCAPCHMIQFLACCLHRTIVKYLQTAACSLAQTLSCLLRGVGLIVTYFVFQLPAAHDAAMLTDLRTSAIRAGASATGLCSDLVHDCLVGSKRATPGKQGERVGSEAVSVLKSPLARGGRSPAVRAFLQAHLREKLASQPYNVASAFVKVCCIAARASLWA